MNLIKRLRKLIRGPKIKTRKFWMNSFDAYPWIICQV